MYRHKEERQSGEQSALKEFWMQQGETRTRVANPYEQDHAKLTGFLVMRFDFYDPVERKHKTSPMSGTASLYERISEDIFVIITAVHNFVQFEANPMRGKAVRKEAREAFFYLACDGQDYKFKFKVLGWKVHPLYERTADFLNGKDVALAAVEIIRDDYQHKDVSKKEFDEDLAKLTVPKAAFIKDAELGKLESAETRPELRILGYPIEVFDAKKRHTEKNRQHLYEARSRPEQEVGLEVETFAEFSTTALKYSSTALVTGKGQSGAAVHMLAEDGSYQTIGVHVGTHKEQNFAAALTEKLFLDFLHPALKELYAQYKTEDQQYA